MPTKIRLQRKGKKGQPFYHIVIADGRAPREGRFIEKIGTYNPLTRPADIDIDFDKAISWLQTGAQPTDTVKAILAYKGVIYKNHLLKGVKKGALSAEQAEEKFSAWIKEKEEKISRKANEFVLSKKEASKKRLAVETEVNEAKAKAIAKKLAKLAENAEKQEEQAAEAEAPAAEAEAPAAEENAETAAPETEAPAAEPAQE